MAEKAGVHAKAQESKQKCSNSCKQNTSYSSSRSPVDRILQLQSTAGNQAVQRLVKSRALQAKLKIGQSNDIYEQEADKVAKEVMQMPDNAAVRSKESGLSKHDESVIQLKLGCPFGKGSSSCPEEEIVQLKALSITPFIHRQVEEEEELVRMKRREEGGTSSLTSSMESSINSLKGGGRRLPDAERAFFEPRFGTDFSNVRVHTDRQASALAKTVQAKAFTVGRDVFFGTGQYAQDRSESRSLLAHELTHVVQQAPGFSADHIRKQDDPVPAEEGPKEKLEAYLNENDFVIPSDADSRSYEDKAEIRRRRLLLQAEIDLHKNPSYTASVRAEFKNLDDYVHETLYEGIYSTATSEDDTISWLIDHKDLDASLETFAEKPFFAQNVGAFPEHFIEIITPLVVPPYKEGINLLSDTEQAKSHLGNTRTELQDYFFEEGLPVGRDRSLNLSGYELIKSKNLRNSIVHLLKERPTSRSDLDFVIDPEEKNLHSGFLAQYQSAWTDYAIKLYGSTIYGNWEGNFSTLKNTIKRGDIGEFDAVGLRSFKNQYASGITSIDDLFRYPATGLFSIVYLEKLNPFVFYNFTRPASVSQAAKQTSQFIEGEYKNFQKMLSSADTKVQGLSDLERLDKSLLWSVKKGFAMEGISEVINNFGNLLTEILKDKVERSIFRRIVSFAASLHPLGRLAVLAYNVYETAENVEEVKDILSLIGRVVAAIDNANNASSIVGVQRSAANLALIYTQVIPFIVQTLSERLRKKLLKGSEKKDVAEEAKKRAAKPTEEEPKHLSPHEREKMLDESRNVHRVDKLEPKYLHAELDSAAGRGVGKSSHPDYEIEATLPNGHKWRRNSKGVWCRFSEDDPTCLLSLKDLPEETKKELAHLDAEAEKFKATSKSGERLSKEDLEELSITDRPPGYKEVNPRTSLGTFIHSRIYTRFCNWLDTRPGQQWLKQNQLTKANFALNLPAGRIYREFEIVVPGYTRKPRADVVDFDNARVHEIKPAGLEQLGFTEAQQYAQWMNLYYKRTDGRLWTPGYTITYDGARVMEIFRRFGYFE